MLHFADYRSPILLEALGDLLLVGNVEENASQLAGLSFLSAKQATVGADAQARFEKMAREAVSSNMELHDEQGISKLQKKLASSLAVAESEFSQIETDELQWIRENRDVDAEFAAKYYESLEAAAQNTLLIPEPWERSKPPVKGLLDRLFEIFDLFLPVGGGWLLAFFGGVALFIWWLRRRAAISLGATNK
jgi:hypothetical protein